MKRILPFLFLFLPILSLANAGIAERYEDHQKWIFPAYAYCLKFELVILGILIILSFIFKLRTKKLVNTSVEYLMDHEICGIFIAGILWSLLLGIIIVILSEVLYYFVIIPLLLGMTFLPMALANRNIREKWMLSPFMLKLTGIFFISAIGASVSFIILTKCGMLPGTDTTYLSYQGMIDPDFCISTHPFDSLTDIWYASYIFMAESLIVMVSFWLGNINLRSCRKNHCPRKETIETFR